MKRIGITGQNGFIGTHLYNTISLQKEEFELVNFQKDIFESQGKLEQWVEKCDVIVHLAAMNRHESEEYIHDTNVALVEKLIAALDSTGSSAQIIFSSSVQEEKDNPYSHSKRKGRLLLAEWAERRGACFTGLIIPNVFGPFGKPFYNSVVATFCRQLCDGVTPTVHADSELPLIFVQELVDVIITHVRKQTTGNAIKVAKTSAIKVSSLLEKLIDFKTNYFDKGVFPSLENSFEVNLFNTFRSYINLSAYFPCKLKQHADERGVFIELAKINIGGQVSYSTTHPEIVRGNHFHTRKIERFIVIKGKALIQLRKYNTEEVFNFELSGDEPSYVDMPVWHIHNIKNIGEEELYTVFWINEFFNSEDPDTWFEKL